MKTNFKPIAIMAIAALTTIGMFSCSKNAESNGNDQIDNGKPTSVSLVLTEKTGSRAVGAPVDEVAVTFSSGYVVFTNGLGIVNKVTQIVPGSYPVSPSTADVDAKNAGTKVWLDDLKTVGVGGEIKNVPAAAEKVYIVGNLPTGVAAPVLAENISAVKDRVITISSQSNGTGDVADVTLYGDGVTLTTQPNGTKYAQVAVNAIASRIEIGQVSYVSPTGFVKKFQIDGIFVNHYYPWMSLAGKVSAVLKHNVPTDNTDANTIFVLGSSDYTDAALFDYNASGLGFNDGSDISWSAADPAELTDKNVWAYNMLAPTSYDGTNVTALAAPHVVIRLSGFETTGDESGAVYPGTQYLTIKEFRKAGTSEVIKSFAPGYIYCIKNLAFNESNLTDIPETEAVTAYVEAVLMTWQRQDVDWSF